MFTAEWLAPLLVVRWCLYVRWCLRVSHLSKEESAGKCLRARTCFLYCKKTSYFNDRRKNNFPASLRCLLCRKGQQKCLSLSSLPLRTGSHPPHSLCLRSSPSRTLARADYILLESAAFSRNGSVQFIQPPRRTLTGLTSVHERDSSAKERCYWGTK